MSRLHRIVSRFATPCTLMVAVGLLSARASAQTFGTGFTYQGELQVSGLPANGIFDMQFSMWNQSSAGTQQGSQLCADNVLVANGRFTVTLDFANNFSGVQRWLQVSVRSDAPTACPAGAAFTLLSPRQQLTPTPHAIIASNASTLAGQPPSFYQSAANLNAGTIPDARLPAAVARTDVPATFSSSVNAGSFAGSGAGITNLSASNISSGVLAPSRGGTGSDTSGASAGQVLKWSGAAWTPGVDVGSILPLTLSTSTNLQTLYVINNGTGEGIAGVAVGAANRAGVLGLNTVAGGRGVEGAANAGTNPVGVFGSSTSGTGRGVQGVANGTNGIGVQGTTLGSAGFGVQGIAFSAGGYGVVGTATGGALAGLFEGDVQVTGTITTPAKERFLSVSPHEIYNNANGSSSVLHSPVAGFASYSVFVRSGSAGDPGTMTSVPLHLPDDASLQDVRLTYNTPNSLVWPRVKLLRYSLTTGVVTTLSNASGDNLGSGDRSFDSVCIPASIIDNSLYSYAIGIESVTEAGGPGPTSIRVYGMRVRYFVTTVLP